MNPNVLRYAIEVERCRSITKAAKQLFVSQPNLSRDIRELEEEIGFSLFTRSSKGVVPTEKGREFLLLARKAVQQFQVLEAFCSHEDKDRLHLEICVPKSPGFFLLFRPVSVPVQQRTNPVRRLSGNRCAGGDSERFHALLPSGRHPFPGSV